MKNKKIVSFVASLTMLATTSGLTAFAGSFLNEKPEKAETPEIVTEEETAEAAVQYLRAYWCFRNNGLSGLHEARDKAIEAMERYLEDNVDKNAALALIDLLRQKGAFDEALETVNSLGKYLRGEENLLKIAAFEWRLIMEEDQESHLMMEMNG